MLLTEKQQRYSIRKKNDKYEFRTDKEILQSDQSRIIEETKLTYLPLGKALKNK